MQWGEVSCYECQYSDVKSTLQGGCKTDYGFQKAVNLVVRIIEIIHRPVGYPVLTNRLMTV